MAYNRKDLRGTNREEREMPGDRLAWLEGDDLGRALPLYLLVGPDEALAARGREFLTGLLLPSEEDRAVGLTVHPGGPGAVAAAVRELAHAAFRLGRRVAVVEKMEHWSPADDKALEEFAAGPPDQASLVVWAPQLDRRSRTFRVAQQVGAVRECPAATLPEVQALAQRVARRRGIPLTAEAARELARRVGPQAARVYPEVEKLWSAVGSDPITPDVVRQLVPVSPSASVFSLVEKAVGGQMGEAMSLLEDLLLQGESAVGLLMLLAREVRLLVYAGTSRARSVTELAGELGVPVFVARRLKEAAARIPAHRAAAWFPLLAEADLRLRRGGEARATLGAVLAGMQSDVRSIWGPDGEEGAWG